MKSFKIILFSFCLSVLSGCATTQSIIRPQIIPPSANTMRMCSITFSELDVNNATYESVLQLWFDEREERKECIRFNREKKEYIERQLQNK